jgi:Rhodanese-like domain
MRIMHLLMLALALSCAVVAAEDQPGPNPLIDYKGFLENAVIVENLRNERRVSEEDFLRMAADPRTIIFDARSDSKFAMLHVQGAKHLSLPDITTAELAKIIPDKSTRILIYCNNNFENEPTALPPKKTTASLNLYTFNTLYSYGYTNVYELGPLIDITRSILPFEGSLVSAKK